MAIQSHVDYGPDTYEETMIKDHIKQLHADYQRAIKPYINALVELRALRMPKIMVWDDGEDDARA